MITYQIESIKNCINDIKLLFNNHYYEVEHDSTLKDFNPNIDGLFHLEDMGILNLFTVRDGDRLVGYYLSMIVPSLNNQDVIQSVESGFFIDKEYRKAKLGLNLLKFVEKSLIDSDVEFLIASTKVEHPCDSLFERVGMKLNERQYIKYIGK